MMCVLFQKMRSLGWSEMLVMLDMDIDCLFEGGVDTLLDAISTVINLQLGESREWCWGGGTNRRTGGLCS